MKGSLAGIFVADVAGGPMRALESARVVAGRGIDGDRYFDRRGTFSPEGASPDHELTLIAAEEVERFAAAAGRSVEPGEIRRNLVTRGVDLNAWVGRRFRIGEVEAEGIRLCEPCRDLAARVGQDVLKGLLHRAGLRARVVTGGTVRVGDEVGACDGKGPGPPR